MRREEQDRIFYDEINSGVYETYFEITPGARVIDVGAQRGYFTQRAARAGAHVLSFEPDPDNQTLFYAWLNEDAQPNVVFRTEAVWSKSGESRRLHQNPEHSGNSSLVWEFDGPSYMVQTIALDDLNIQKCNLLKIDAEASEVEILKGAKKLIRQLRPVVVMEIHSVALHTAVAEQFTEIGGYSLTRDWSKIPPDHYNVGIFWGMPNEVI